MRRARMLTGAVPLMGLLLAACGGTEGAEKASAARADDTPRAVRVALIEQRSLAGGLSASGQLIAREEAAVGSELAGYRVARVLVDNGALVTAGQPLVQLDDTLLRAQIDQASATLQQQRVNAQRLQGEADRVAGLAEEGVVARELVEQRRFDALGARAQVAAAQAGLAELQTRRTRFTIRAPVSGRVLQRTVRPGDISGAGGEPYFRIARGGLVELSAELPESELVQIRVGAPVKVTLPGGQTANGAVRLIEPVVDPVSRLGTVRVLLNPGPGQRPGGFGTATFTQSEGSALAAPEAAVRFDANGPAVLVVAVDNTVKRTPVRTGRRANGFVELVQGPPAGSRVLLGGSAFVLEGDKVRPVPSAVQPRAGTPAAARPGVAP